MLFSSPRPVLFWAASRALSKKMIWGKKKMVLHNCHLWHQTKGMVGITDSVLRNVLPQSGQHTAPIQCTHFPSVFWSVKFLFKCRCMTGTSENCFPWSVHAIIMRIVSKEKLILWEKWQNSNKMWPWIQMYLYWRKKLPFFSVIEMWA